MNDSPDETESPGAGSFVVFEGFARLVSGTLAEAALAAKRAQERGTRSAVLVFDQATGAVTDLDLRGTEAEIAARHAPLARPATKRGRPKLGVVAREVTLLPRHWEWLASQPGGASVALRRLVEAARKLDSESGAPRRQTEAAYRFMSAMAGDLPGFEDAARALFAQDRERLLHCIRAWAPDIRDQLLRYLGPSGEASPG
ncbi:DUF2239 family protein [Teichococcus aestuarii]|uniref:DUF2239 domain-containing protein n=1 Tax=Teichococcus aestuarii TaxID=568898 RepID=A0A2U1V1Q9_9PROT|nr:DUF2239 family protein [Pseudoroseomonas aestuarii]PWC27823.1 hypothetical protein CR165_16125 [Pseudoroseomonas aestuarii]